MTSRIQEREPSRELTRSRLTGSPYISILLPVRNEERFIAETLRQLLAQRYDPKRFEVLVADGDSTDATAAIVAEFERHHEQVHLLDNPGRWSSAGRNVAIAAAQGELLVLVDGHCELDNPDYLTELAAAFQRSGADCVGRPQPLDVTGATPLQRAIAAGRSSRLGHHPASHIYSAREGFVPPDSVAIAYRRSVFEQVGLFDETFDACEDVEFNHRVARAGLRCFFTPRVQVRYYPRLTLAGLFGQMMRYGRGRARLLRKHRGTFSLPGFLPAGFLAGATVGPLLAWLWPLLWLPYGACLGIYTLVVMLFSLTLSLRKRQPLWLVVLPFVFLTIHAGAGMGLLWELLAGPLDRLANR
jgi:succinoglycan biosynthesis protein ExoA